MVQKLRPVVYTANHTKKGHQNTAQQMFLLKALKITQDPKKLRDMMGVSKVAEVYQTLDKLAMRKEYHKALAKLGISFDYIAGGIKKIADTGEKDADRLKALQTLLKSTGMDVYDSAEVSSGTWEEVLLSKIAEEKDLNLPSSVPVYEVVVPEIPESARIQMEEDKEITGSVYDSK